MITGSKQSPKYNLIIGLMEVFKKNSKISSCALIDNAQQCQEVIVVLWEV